MLLRREVRAAFNSNLLFQAAFIISRLSPLRVAALVTGGKDSALALHRSVGQGFEVNSLVTMMPQRDDSWMFHYPNIHMADLFAKAVGIPLVKAETSGIREKELTDLKQVLARLSVDAVISGCISSQYQKENIDKICKDLKLQHVTPLWHENPLELLNEMVELKMETIIVGVYAHGFTSEWLGRKLGEAAMNELIDLNQRFQVSLMGEGGEYETLVLDATFFKKQIELIETEKIWQGQSGYLLVKKAALINKKRKLST